MDDVKTPGDAIQSLSSKLLDLVTSASQYEASLGKDKYELATRLLNDMSSVVEKINFDSLPQDMQRSLKKRGISLFNSKIKNHAVKAFARHGGCLRTYCCK